VWRGPEEARAGCPCYYVSVATNSTRLGKTGTPGRARPDQRVGVVFAGADGDGVDVGVEAGVDVALAVADHVTVCGVEAVLGHHLDGVGGRGLAVTRRLVGPLGSDADAVENRAWQAEEFVHAVVAAVDIVEGIHTAADAGLVGDDEEPIAKGASAGEGGGDAGDEFHAGRIGEVVFVEDEGAVAIEEEGFHDER
jgi:hypothetical protein